MPGNRHVAFRTTLSILLPILASVPGCDQGNYSPGAGRDDVSFFILVGEPTGESLRPLLGLELTSEADIRWDGNALASLEEIGVRTLAYAPVTLADSLPDGDPNLRGIIGSGMQVLLEFSISGEGTAHDGYPLLSQAVRQCTDAALWGEGASRVDILITSLDGDTLDMDVLSFSAGRLAETVRALRSEFPSLSVGAGGWTLESDRWKGVASELIDALGGTSSRPGFISFRLPPGMPSDITPLVSELRRLLGEQGLGETELVLSGWTPEDADAPGRSPSQALLAAWWISLQSAGLADAFLAPGAGWDSFADGTPSPLLGTLSLFSEFADHSSRLATAVTMDGDQWCEPDGRNRLWVLAGEDSSGEVAVLLANTTSDTATVDVTYLVPTLAAGFRTDVMRVDPSDGRTVWTGPDRPSLEIVPQEALLVIAAPF